ncbi:MAG: hypothetical protein JXA19_07520, partial [Anaerolineales bacterium]|nr:hypothetical protein [Anaerolineales bacterium]
MIKNDLKAKIIPPESLILLSGILLISILLPWISNGFTSITGWFSFLVIISISSLLLVLGVAIVKEDTPPPWLSWMTVGAFLLRLGLGVLWFVALPEVGYDNEVNNDGYVMSDAWKRDLAAWDLSQSDENLLSSFNGYSSTDQYGGLLFISAFIYRFLGGTIHQPLLLVVFCAAFSSLVVPFIWSLSKNLFGEK